MADSDPLVFLYHKMAPEQRRIAQAYARCILTHNNDEILIQSAFRHQLINHNEMTILLNASGKVVYMSWSAEQLFRYPLSQVLGKSIYKTIGRKHSPEDMAAAWESLRKGESAAVTAEAVCANDEELIIHIEKIPVIVSGKLIGKCCRIRPDEHDIRQR